ncbi:hypothetical protein L596_014090 [Steinernema carpocapsae]|uniref:L27 domain-containing protein n=1 Tax=Steinernema carpocapsae TaxID=34508 RepID=A0A4U5NBF0_STECR|nr:hypothetical protein L596_014090 [Steinernema carpocapsae]
MVAATRTTTSPRGSSSTPTSWSCPRASTSRNRCLRSSRRTRRSRNPASHRPNALYDRISNLNVEPVTSSADACHCVTEVSGHLDGLLAPSAEANELKHLLGNEELKGILQAYDIVIQEVYAGHGTDPEDMIAVTQEPSTSANSQTRPISLPQPYQNGRGPPTGVAAVPGCSSSEDSSAVPTSGPLFDDDDDLMMDVVSRVRLVQFQKDTEEPMGITLKTDAAS